MSKGNAKLLGIGASRSDFANRLGSHLVERGSIQKLSRDIGASVSAIRKWKDGETEPSRDYLIAIALALDINLLWLMTGQGPMKDMDQQAIDEIENKSNDLLKDQNFTETAMIYNLAGLEPTVMDRAVLSSIFAAFLKSKEISEPLSTTEGLLKLHDDTVSFLRNSFAHDPDTKVALKELIDKVIPKNS